MSPSPLSTSLKKDKGNGFARAFKKFPIRTVLIAPFILQIVSAVGLVGYLSFSNGQRAVNNLATQLSEKVTDQIDLRLENYLRTAHLFQKMKASSIQNGNLDVEDFEQLQRQFWSDIKLSEAVDYIFIGDEEGQFLGVQQYPDGRTVVKFRDRDTAPERLVYQLDQDGDRVEQLKSKEYDPRVRPWYIKTLEEKVQTWSPIYASADLGALQITATTPVYLSDGELHGVLGTNLILSEIGRFLQELKISQSGEAFIIERSADLIASSTEEAPYLEVEGEEDPLRLNAKDSREPAIKLTTQKLVEQFGDLRRLTESKSTILEINGEQQWVQITPLRNAKGLDWLIIVAIPRSDFMAEINQNTRNTILLCVAALILATVIGILTAQWITQPILRLNDAAKEVAQGHWDKHVELDRADEVGELAKSFNSMAGQLKESFDTLEDKVEERTAELAQANDEIAALNQRLKAENLRLSAELELLREMQQLILPKPKELAAIADLEIAGFMEPADEVGGDYYDVLYTDGVVTVGIGDVTGHGLESGILMVMAQTAVRVLSEIREVDPIRFLDTLNRTIYKNVERMNSDKNLSLAILNYADGRLGISGQHEETLIVRRDGRIERIDTIDLGFPIGLDSDIASFVNHTLVELEPGDGVVLYTDGITEAEDIDGQLYGIERLCKIVSQSWSLTAEEIEGAVIDDVRRHIGQQKVFDDITLLILKLKPQREGQQQEPVAAGISFN